MKSPKMTETNTEILVLDSFKKCKNVGGKKPKYLKLKDLLQNSLWWKLVFLTRSRQKNVYSRQPC